MPCVFDPFIVVLLFSGMLLFLSTFVRLVSLLVEAKEKKGLNILKLV